MPPDLINNLSEKLEGVLLFPDIDRLSEKPESPPELFGDVVLKLGLEQVAEHVLELVEDGLLVDRVQVDAEDLQGDKQRSGTFPEQRGQPQYGPLIE